MNETEGKAAVLSERELIDLMLEYSDKSAELEEIAEKIRVQVLLRGESYKIADVTATYYKQSHKTDYKQAAMESAAISTDPDALEVYRKPPQYDFRRFCIDHGIDLEQYTKPDKAPRVVIRRKKK